MQMSSPPCSKASGLRCPTQLRVLGPPRLSSACRCAHIPAARQGRTRTWGSWMSAMSAGYRCAISEGRLKLSASTASTTVRTHCEASPRCARWIIMAASLNDEQPFSCFATLAPLLLPPLPAHRRMQRPCLTWPCCDSSASCSRSSLPFLALNVAPDMTSCWDGCAGTASGTSAAGSEPARWVGAPSPAAPRRLLRENRLANSSDAARARCASGASRRP